MFNRKDPRDEIIEILRKDKERLELRVAELTNKLVALVDARANRALNPLREDREPVGLPPRPVDPRTEIYHPKQSFEDIARVMARRELKES